MNIKDKIKILIKKDSTMYFFLKKLKMDYLIYKISRMNQQELQKYVDKLYIKHIGKKVNWNNPKTYTEKIQCEKLRGDSDEKIMLSDKYRVREWVKKRIGEEYLINLLGVWEKAADIDFNQLPEQFVLKTNCSSGDVIIVKNKESLSKNQIKKYKKKLDFYLNCKYGVDTAEFQYSKMNPVIIAEEYISTEKEDLPDYKFLCFDGVPYYCWVDNGRYHSHKRNVYDMQWQLQSWRQKLENTKEKIDKPKNFEEMKKIASKLAQGFSHVRVDLYNIDGKIYFGEMTFSNGSGFERIIPQEADYMLGNLWKIR